MSNSNPDECRALGRVRSLSDLVLGFLEEEEDGHVESPSIEDDENVENPEDKAFWEEQHHLLEGAMSMSSSVEARIARKIQSSRGACSCSCPRNAGAECRTCRLQAILERLRDSGYDCALCKSKWRSSMGIPSGEHRYLDVMYKSSNVKKGPVRILIELNFRAEFEVARANREYETLVGCLPEVFVGRPGKLESVIKVMCTAAKKCMRDNGLHMGPWRKHKYMQAKWLSAPAERVAKEDGVAKSIAGGGWFTEENRRSPRLRSSMLTSDLLEKLPAAMHCTAVKVQ